MLTLDKERIDDLLAGTHGIIIEKLIPFLGNSTHFKRSQKAIIEGITHIGRIPQIFDLVEDFKYDNELFFIRSLTTSYVASVLLGQFDWETPEFHSKIATSCLVADILLFEDDLEKLNDWERGELDRALLSEELMGQSERVVELLSKYKLPTGKPFFSPEVITIVAQHNERGDGSGIPNMIKHSSITLLTSVYLVARYFTFLLTEISFDSEFKKNIQIKIQERFVTGHLKVVGTNLVRLLSA